MTDLAKLTPGTWNVDLSHSTVGFVARHLMVTKVRGKFSEFEATVTIADNPLESSVEATVQTASFNTGESQRDEHVKGADFLDVEQFPTMTFVSTGITQDDDDYVLTGDLTIKGQTRSVDFELEFEGVAQDPWGGTRVGFTAETKISRKDWGLEWNVALETGGVLVGDSVKLVLDIQAVKAQ